MIFIKFERINITNFEKKILKNKFSSTFLWNHKKIEYIKNSDSKNKKIIIFIFIIENINRGGFLNHTLEKLLVILFPNLVKKYNLSVGLFQIKYSFLKLYAPDIDIKNVFNLNHCILALDNFLNHTNYLEVPEQISLYHSGQIKNEYRSTHIYIYLYKWFDKHFNI